MTVSPFLEWPRGEVLILASMSPRRADLLGVAGIPYEVVPAIGAEADLAAQAAGSAPEQYARLLAGAKAALAGIETFRTIRKGQFENCETGVINEITFIANLFPAAA